MVGRRRGRVDSLRAVIEITRFALCRGTDETSFLAADKEFQEEFAYRQPGLLRRTTARAEDGRYVVIDLWRSDADADTCAQRWDSDPVVARFLEHVDRTSLHTERYYERD